MSVHFLEDDNTMPWRWWYMKMMTKIIMTMMLLMMTTVKLNNHKRWNGTWRRRLMGNSNGDQIQVLHCVLVIVTKYMTCKMIWTDLTQYVGRFQLIPMRSSAGRWQNGNTRSRKVSLRCPRSLHSVLSCALQIFRRNTRFAGMVIRSHINRTSCLKNPSLGYNDDLEFSELFVCMCKMRTLGTLLWTLWVVRFFGRSLDLYPRVYFNFLIIPTKKGHGVLINKFSYFCSQVKNV